MEVMNTPNYPWIICTIMLILSLMVHSSPRSISISSPSNVNFHTFDHIDWFKNPIPISNAFEEGNMANNSQTIKWIFLLNLVLPNTFFLALSIPPSVCEL
jgi:hypothetical protein